MPEEPVDVQTERALHEAIRLCAQAAGESPSGEAAVQFAEAAVRLMHTLGGLQGIRQAQQAEHERMLSGARSAAQ